MLVGIEGKKYVQKCEYALRNDTVSYKPYHNKDKGEWAKISAAPRRIF